MHDIAAGNQDRYQIGLVLQSLGRVALSRGDYAESEWLFNEGLATAARSATAGWKPRRWGVSGRLLPRLATTRARELHRAAVATAAAAPLPIALDELAALANSSSTHNPSRADRAGVCAQHPLVRPNTRERAQQRQRTAQEYFRPSSYLRPRNRAHLPA